MSVSFCFANDEGVAIRGDVDAPAERGPVIVGIHGFKGFKDWGFWPETARRLCDAGYAVVRFNFAHSGIGSDLQTFSEPRLFETGTYSREVVDLKQVLDRVASGELPSSERIDPSRIGLLAHSRGSISALAVAGSHSFVRSIALWNPVSQVLWWNEEERRRWRQRGFWEVVNVRTRQTFRMAPDLLEDAERNRDALDPVANAGRLLVPLLAVVSRGDESVPPDSGRLLARAAAGNRGRLVELEETGHTFGAAHPMSGLPPALAEAIRLTREHFDQTL